MESSFGCSCKKSKAEEELDLLEGQVAKAIVPSKEFLLRLTQVQVVLVDSCNCSIEGQAS